MTRRLTIREIQLAVADDYGLPVRVLLSDRRDREATEPRFAAVWLAAELTGAGLSEIGRRFGGRDHTTIRSALARTRGRRLDDPEFAERLRRLAVRLGGETSPAPGTGTQLAFPDDGPLFARAAAPGSPAHA